MTIDARTAPANAPRTWDFLLTVVFVLLQVLLAIALLVSAFSFGTINSGCQTAEGGCDVTAVRIGQALCTFGPPAIALVSIPWAIARVLRRRIGFWVSLLGGVLMVGVFLLGSTLMAMGLPST
jgi:hypothetical protein